MYESYYQLQAKPFTLLPDPEFLYLGARHKTALSLLEYGLLNGSAFIVITGEPGTGKTTLLNRLLEQSGRHWTIGMLSNTHGLLGGLMPWIAAAFGLLTKGKSEVELFQEFGLFLEAEHAAGHRVLLVLDEAQNVGADMLEEIRLLSNLNDGRRRSLQILLSGQPGLREVLQRPAMEQFAQRIAVEYALEPLVEEEGIAYIAHRLQVAGRRRPLFSTLACRKIFALTGGVPRLINQLCDHALVYGYAAQAPMITARVALDAAQARDRIGFHPFRVTPDSIEPSQGELDAESAEMAANAPAEPVKRHGRKPADSATSEAGALYAEALAFKQAGDFHRAKSLFERLISDPVWGMKALAQKGLCLKATGLYDEALDAFREGLDRPPTSTQDFVSLRYLQARTLEAMGRTEEAVECYRAISFERQNYRDVDRRIDQLQLSLTPDHLGANRFLMRLQSLVRSCSQLLRSPG